VHSPVNNPPEPLKLMGATEGEGWSLPVKVTTLTVWKLRETVALNCIVSSQSRGGKQLDVRRFHLRHGRAGNTAAC